MALRFELVILRIAGSAANIRAGRVPGHVMKIRLVEDSYIERHKIGSYLTDWGLDHVDVGTGTEAIKLLEAPDPPKMALLDWMLPGLDGIDVCRRIRKLTGAGTVDRNSGRLATGILAQWARGQARNLDPGRHRSLQARQ